FVTGLANVLLLVLVAAPQPRLQRIEGGGSEPLDQGESLVAGLGIALEAHQVRLEQDVGPVVPLELLVELLELARLGRRSDDRRLVLVMEIPAREAEVFRVPRALDLHEMSRSAGDLHAFAIEVERVEPEELGLVGYDTGQAVVGVLEVL